MNLNNCLSLFNHMPTDSTSKPPIIVISNAAGGAGGASPSNKDAKDNIKLGNFSLPTKTLVTIGSLVGIAVVGYYAYQQMPALIDYLTTIGQPASQQTSGTAAVSGASAPIPPADVSTYPGTGAGNFPPPATGIGAYPYTTQPYPTAYPYQTAPTAAIAAQTPMPTTQLGSSVVRSYHAHMTPRDYLDHRGKRRSFINELHIEEVIGSERDTERVLSLNEE
jgi:hypothetical protein